MYVRAHISCYSTLRTQEIQTLKDILTYATGASVPGLPAGPAPTGPAPAAAGAAESSATGGAAVGFEDGASSSIAVDSVVAADFLEDGPPSSGTAAVDGVVDADFREDGPPSSGAAVDGVVAADFREDGPPSSSGAAVDSAVGADGPSSSSSAADDGVVGSTFPEDGPSSMAAVDSVPADFREDGPSSTSSAVVAADFPQSEDGPPISRSAAADASEHGPSSGTDEVGTDSREDLDEPSSDAAHAAEEVCATAASAEDGSGPLHSSATPGLDGVDSSQQQAAVRENAASSNEMEAPQLMVQAIPHPDQMETQVSDDTLAELEAIATEARALHESRSMAPKKTLPPVPSFAAPLPAESPTGQI